MSRSSPIIYLLRQYQRRERLSALMERHRRRCHWCTRPVFTRTIKHGRQAPRDTATEDHLITQTEGGGDFLDNLVLACWACNNRRGNMSPEDFRRLLDFEQQDRRAVLACVEVHNA